MAIDSLGGLVNDTVGGISGLETDVDTTMAEVELQLALQTYGWSPTAANRQAVLDILAKNVNVAMGEVVKDPSAANFEKLGAAFTAFQEFANVSE